MASPILRNGLYIKKYIDHRINFEAFKKRLWRENPTKNEDAEKKSLEELRKATKEEKAIYNLQNIFRNF